MRKKIVGNIVFEIFNYMLMIVLVIVILYLFLYVFVVLLNDFYDVIKGGIIIFFRKFILVNYIEIVNYF